jgi:N-acetylglucosamine-6-phosphate deacetylase
LGNGCAAELNRHDNILWRVMDQPGLFTTLIPDGIHVPPALFRIFHRALDPRRICYITDAMSAGGAVPGNYALGQLRLQVGPDEIVRQPGTTYLSGSALRPIEGILRAARMLGCPWQEAWRRFSEAPAELIGLPTGGLSEGQPAHFCVLQDSGDGILHLINCAGDEVLDEPRAVAHAGKQGAA